MSLVKRLTSRGDILHHISTASSHQQLTEPAVQRVFERTAYGSVPRSDAVIIELCLECREIPNMDIGSLSDPFAVLYEIKGVAHSELSRTETVWDDLNPRFVRCFYLNYTPPSIENGGFERNLRVEVYDRDKRNDDLAAHDFIGAAAFKLSQVVNSADKRIEIHLENKAKPRLARRNYGSGEHRMGTLIVMANDINTCVVDHSVEFRISAAELRKRNYFHTGGLMGQFYTVSRLRREESGRIHWTPVYRSEVRYRSGATGYVKYDAANVTIQTMNNGNPQLPTRLEFWQRERRTGHERLGFVDLSLERLQRMATGVDNKHVPIEGEFQDERVGFVVVPCAGAHGDNFHTFFELNVNFFSCKRYESSVHAATRRNAVSRSQSNADGMGSGIMNGF